MKTSKPPVVKRIASVREIHGYREEDNYAWLADKTKENKEVLAYLKAENDYTEAVLQPTEALQEVLYQEMRSRIKEADEEVPSRFGAYVYYMRTETDRQYPFYCRKPEYESGQEEILLDLNQLAEGEQFFSLGHYEVSDDGEWLAFTTDTLGYRQYQLSVKNLVTGEVNENIAERVDSLAWSANNETLFFVEEDDTTKRANRFFRLDHKTGVKTLLYEEKDELYNIFCDKTRSQVYITLTVQSSLTSEVRFLKAEAPLGELTLLFPREDGREYYLDHSGDLFFIRINDTGKNFRLITLPTDQPLLEQATEILSHREDCKIEYTECFARYTVVGEREGGLNQYRVLDMAGHSRRIEFPEPVYETYPRENLEFDTERFRLTYESFVTPTSTMEYNMETGVMKLLKERVILGGYTKENYESKRLMVPVRDGTLVPISLVYKKSLRQVGPQPLLLNGYGSYGVSNDVYFSSNLLSLLDRGMIFAIAHIRGGGEMGEVWYETGKLMQKMNTFTDFIDCAEYFVRERYTTSSQLAITGRSAGGLLMGAVANIRPDLFRAIVSGVPFVDTLNTMLDSTLPLTVGEYLEWGNPNEKAAYDYMRSYAPYDNLEAKAYPAMLLLTSLHDSQVPYWEAAKYVAKLRSLKKDNQLLLLNIKLDPAGHGGASGRFDRLRDLALEHAFILTELGVEKR